MADKNIAKKEKAIEIMKKMDIYKPYIKGFRESDKVCFFEGFGGFWIDQEPELHEKMKAIEEKHKCKVYAVTHEYTEFGELYDFLIVTDYPEEWDTLVYTEGSRHTAFAYVWNKDDDWCSEFGSVTVQSFGGGIRRDKDITLVLDYAFRRLFSANTNLLILSCIGKTKEQMMPEIMQLLESCTQYRTYLEETNNG